MVSGEVYNSGGSPCNDPCVQITNTNTGDSWTATTSETSNYYQLVLDSSDVSDGDILKIEASGCSQSKTVEHTVAESEINRGGFSQDITLEESGDPDLTVTEKSEEWISIEDKTYNITYTVKNTGSLDAGASTTSIEIDGVEFATDPVPALAVDESHTKTLGPFTMSGNDDMIEVCADNEHVVDESNEENNCLENELECAICPKPDLVITGKSEEWIDPVNKTYNITYTVENTGSLDAGASTTSIRIDGVEATTDPVPALPADQSYTSTLGPFTMSGNDDRIEVCADSANAVDESNEENNCRENTFKHQAVAVPILTPFGLAALIGLLLIVGVVNIRWKEE
ncbi:MAG: hypothetical protein SYNGOMJ08_00500 [Candidatus Syntrophoarchaeum sp. GoM_oil]|nr:MAG: hypothetical protein SYNGOMJ08_00500 [Candidatus Syntrophoarchaeum sp. GoM_oil]